MFYYSGQGTSCSQTGILQPSCENKSSNKWFILASYYEWGLYIFKLLFHTQNKCCCHSFLEYSCLCLCFRSLVKTKVKEEMRKEIQLNQKVQHLTQAH